MPKESLKIFHKTPPQLLHKTIKDCKSFYSEILGRSLCFGGGVKMVSKLLHKLLHKTIMI